MGCNLDKVQSTEAAGDVQLSVSEKLQKGIIPKSYSKEGTARWHFSCILVVNGQCIIQRALRHLRLPQLIGVRKSSVLLREIEKHHGELEEDTDNIS